MVSRDWRPRSTRDLMRYCWHVAGAVGVMMAKVMGVRSDDGDTLDRAADLGFAFQLANIARDIAEDDAADRCYIPVEWLVEEDIEPMLMDSREEVEKMGATCWIQVRVDGETDVLTRTRDQLHQRLVEGRVRHVDPHACLRTDAQHLLPRTRDSELREARMRLDRSVVAGGDACENRELPLVGEPTWDVVESYSEADCTRIHPDLSRASQVREFRVRGYPRLETHDLCADRMMRDLQCQVDRQTATECFPVVRDGRPVDREPVRATIDRLREAPQRMRVLRLDAGPAETVRGREMRRDALE